MSTKMWILTKIILIILFGTILHFIYEWLGKSPVIGIIGAVNESTWEHLKLLFWPTLIISVIEYILVGNKYNNFITGIAISLISGMLLIIILFYTYTGIWGKDSLIMDIGIFIISVIVSQLISNQIVTLNMDIKSLVNILSLHIIGIMMLSFVWFTFIPPKIPLFQDPVTKCYGIGSAISN
ncbi:MAG: DUF6512 family protein [Eubacteriales bacterium]